MQITLPPEAQAIIDHKLESGRYASGTDVIVDALRQLEDVPYIDDSLLIEAREQADRGETRELTDEVWNEIRDRARDDARNGSPISDDVKY